MKKLTKAEIKKKLELHLKWIKSEDGGEWANLSGADLSKANLLGANLSKANLSKANLSKANLSGADLSWANLSGANLSWADLSKADLSWADLLWADLSGADLSGANLWVTQWPLWCGTRKVKIDAKIAMQLAAHYCAVECDDPEYQETRKAIIKFALRSHVARDLDLEE